MKEQLVTSLQGALRPDEINCGIKVILKKKKGFLLPTLFIFFIRPAAFVSSESNGTNTKGKGLALQESFPLCIMILLD